MARTLLLIVLFGLTAACHDRAPSEPVTVDGSMFTAPNAAELGAEYLLTQ